jgi:integrase
MAISRCHRLAYADWPAEDRRLWEELSREMDVFDEELPISRLSVKKQKAMKYYYGAFLGYLAIHCAERLRLPPEARLDRDLIADYVQNFLGDNYPGSTLATFIDHLRYVLSAFSPDGNWSWLREIANRLRAHAEPKPQRHITSDLLLRLGLELMDRAEAEATAVGAVTVDHAKTFRDGLIIALLAAVPLRRGTLAKLSVGKQLIRSGSVWALDIPAEDTKTRVPLEYSISPSLSARIDTYLEKFRCRFPGADTHDALWASMRKGGQPLTGSHIYQSVVARTCAAFGFAVTPHRFRHAAATFWGERDPANVRGAKDLLGHASFQITEKYYNMAKSRIAGRTLVQAIDSVRSFYRPQLRVRPLARASDE